MLFQGQNNSQEALKKLWGTNVPPLTPEQVDLATKVWKKIKARKQQLRNDENFN